MRKVIAYELLSLDGVAEDPDEFFTDFVMVGTAADWVPTEILYVAYRAFCSARGYPSLGNNRFVQSLKRVFPQAEPDRQVVDRAVFPHVSQDKARGYRGLKFFPRGLAT